MAGNTPKPTVEELDAQDDYIWINHKVAKGGWKLSNDRKWILRRWVDFITGKETYEVEAATSQHKRRAIPASLSGQGD